MTFFAINLGFNVLKQKCFIRIFLATINFQNALDKKMLEMTCKLEIL